MTKLKAGRLSSGRVDHRLNPALPGRLKVLALEILLTTSAQEVITPCLNESILDCFMKTEITSGSAANDLLLLHTSQSSRTSSVVQTRRINLDHLQLDYVLRIM